MTDSRISAAATEVGRFGYVPALDGIRAVAIVLVLIHHGLQPIEFGGYVGVDVFFALSGFLITSILTSDRRKHGHIRMKRFYWRRAVRLYPPLLVAVAAILPFGLLLRGPVKHLLEVALAVTYLTPVAGEFAGWGGQIWLHTWSLGIEEIFYLVWPLTLILLVRLRVRHQAWITVGLIGLLFAAAQAALVFNGHEPSYFLRSAGMLFGCALALWMSYNRTRPAEWIGWAGFALIAVSVAFGNIDRWNSLAYSLAALGTVGIIAAVIRTPEGAITRALSIRPAVYIGKISYELYLWHYPVLVCIMLALGSDNLNVGAWFGIPLAVALAALTEWRLRKPTKWLRSRIT